MATMISGLEVRGPVRPGDERLLTPDAMALLAELEGRFGPERQRLMEVRRRRQALVDAGERPGVLPETRAVREADWTVATPPHRLPDGPVAVVGPAGRAAIGAALDTGARVVVADVEDGTVPTWANLLDGQADLRDAVRRTTALPAPAVLALRPRGWPREEGHVRMDGVPVSAALFDVALHLADDAHRLLERGAGPCLWLPKLESHFEARLWNEALTVAEEYLRLPHGAIRTIVAVETIHAAFELDEILYELRDRAAGLTCGHRNRIVSFIKTFGNDPAAVLPDLAAVTGASPFLRSCAVLAVRTAHRRGVPVTGAAAADGGDGAVAAADPLAVPDGPRSDAGLRQAVAVGLGRLEAWLRGVGAVDLFDRTEDTASAEVSRALVWQWLRHGALLDDGSPVTRGLVERTVAEELTAWRQRVGDAAADAGRWDDAAALFLRLATAPAFEEVPAPAGDDRPAGREA
ncbi:malate synthase A [Azospirillum sp. ST 5-10]|uniref:malate synthase A n=1 Tax=unclassified Azospirillum TaxID=2630922 RepID=UPI003F4A46F6